MLLVHVTVHVEAEHNGGCGVSRAAMEEPGYFAETKSIFQEQVYGVDSNAIRKNELQPTFFCFSVRPWPLKKLLYWQTRKLDYKNKKAKTTIPPLQK